MAARNNRGIVLEFFETAPSIRRMRNMLALMSPADNQALCLCFLIAKYYTYTQY